jgi:DNA topoisomerase-1
LTNYFRRYLEYDYTANLEAELDDVSAGDKHYKDVLERFWRDFSAAVAETSELRITEVLEKINEVLEPHLFPPKEDGSDPRVCPRCGAGRLSMRTARSGGAFIGCSQYPECRYTRPFGPPSDDADSGDSDLNGKMLGVDPDTNEAVFLMDGRFGWYVQLGEVTADVKKPPRASLPKIWKPEDVDIDKALTLLRLPRLVGQHPDDGEPIEANFGRYGPYVKHGRIYANLSDEEEVFTVGMNRAVEVLAEKAAKRGGGRGAAAAPLKELGEHPSEGGPVNIMNGRYGPYVKWGKVNATLPKDVEPEAITMERAVELITEKQAKGGKKGRKSS